MTGGKDRARLLHMLDSARLISQYLAGVKEPAFLNDVQLQDSVVRRLEIIGEAASHVSKETKGRHPDVSGTRRPGYAISWPTNTLT